MIVLDEVVKTYTEVPVLGPLSRTIASGGVTALVGPNGAGKSTLLTIIGRLLAPTSGRVEVAGLDVQATRSEELARVLSILRQENHLNARLTVRDLVGFGRFPHSRGRLTAADHARVDQALEFLDLTELAGRFLDELSGGQRQRAFVAMVLAQDTDYVLLDEPLNNLDIRHAIAMMRQLRAAADRLGRTIAVVLHDINIAAAFADRIIALRDGAIVAEGTPAELMTAETLTAVFETPVRVVEVDGQPTAVYLAG